MEAIMRRMRGGQSPPGVGGGGAEQEAAAAAAAPPVADPAASATAAAADGLIRALSAKPLKILEAEQQPQTQQQRPQAQQQQQPWALAAAWGSSTPTPSPPSLAPAPAPAPAAPAPPLPPRTTPHVQVDFTEPESQHRPSFFAAARASAAALLPPARNGGSPSIAMVDAATATTTPSAAAPPSRPPPPLGCTDARARDLALKGEGLLSVYPLLPHALRRDKWRLRHFSLVQALHKGYASTVYRARCNATGELVALKVYLLQGLTPLTVYQCYREVALHSSVVSDGSVALYSAWREGDGVVLCMEDVSGGDLGQVLRGAWGGRVTERHAVTAVIEPLLSTLCYLHARGIAHRDIKPENLLLTPSGKLKLADYGLSIDMHSESAVTRAGTLQYMAPEVLRCALKRSPSDHKMDAPTVGYGHGVDVWSVGVLAYELCTGVTPFVSPGGNKERTAAAIQRGLFAAGDNFRWPPRFSEELKSFVTAALQPDPARRATAAELAQHPWVAQYRRPASQAQMVVVPAVAGAVQAGRGGQARQPRATVDEVGRGLPFVAVSPAPGVRRLVV